jgi:hypothetical protein
MRTETWVPLFEGGIMGRQPVLQITCDRCTRIETRPISEAKEEKKVPDFDAVFMGKRCRWEDLCTPCREIVNGHWGDIARKLKKSSPHRVSKEKAK